MPELLSNEALTTVRNAIWKAAHVGAESKALTEETACIIEGIGNLLTDAIEGRITLEDYGYALATAIVNRSAINQEA